MISMVLSVESVSAEHNGQKGYVSFEFEMIKTFFEGFILINDGHVGNAVHLVKFGNSVLH